MGWNSQNFMFFSVSFFFYSSQVISFFPPHILSLSNYLFLFRSPPQKGRGKVGFISQVADYFAQQLASIQCKLSSYYYLQPQVTGRRGLCMK